MAEPNESPLLIPSGSVGGPPSLKAWQSGTDDALRRAVSEKILLPYRRLHQQMQPGHICAGTGCEEKLRGLAEVLERKMYDNAATKEEYSDPVTFESRLWTASMQRRRERCGSLLSSVQSYSYAMQGPTSGNISVSGAASRMIATSGSAGIMVPTRETVDDCLMSLMEDLNLGAEDK